MKNKEGRRTSHSYLSLTHGPKETTHDTSEKHPWWTGDFRRSALPPAGCREEVFWCSRCRKRGGGGTEARSRKGVLSSRLSRDGEYIGEGGQPGGPPGGPGAPLARPAFRVRHQGAWAPGGGPLAPLRFFCADFYLIFPEFLEHF